jgi:hypothetical protein
MNDLLRFLLLLRPTAHAGSRGNESARVGAITTRSLSLIVIPN